MELRELTNPKDVKRFKQVMDALHPMGHPKGGVFAKGWRYWAYCDDNGEWRVLMSTHQLSVFFFSVKFRLPMDRTIMLRRILTLQGGEGLASEAIKALAQRLKDEGWHYLVTLSTKGHSGALYKHAGMEKVGETRRGHGVWVLKLH